MNELIFINPNSNCNNIEQFIFNESNSSNIILDESNSNFNNIQDFPDSTNSFFSQLHDIMLFEHNNDTRTTISNLLQSLPTENYQHNTKRNNTRNIASTNNSDNSKKINLQKKTRKIFNRCDQKNVKRRTSEHINTSCCHNISLFQQIIETPFSDFAINRISLAKNLKSISIKHKQKT